MNEATETELQTMKVTFSARRFASQSFQFARSLDGVSLALIWACVATARVATGLADGSDIANGTAALIAMPLLVLIPRSLGLFASRAISSWGLTHASVDRFVAEWLVGVVLLILAATLLTGIANVPAEATAVLILALASCGVLMKIGESDAPVNAAAGTLRGSWPYLLALGLIAAPLILIRSSQPYPLQVGWGLFSFSFRTLQFTETDHIAIAPGLHTPIHASILGVTSIVTGVAPDGLIWAAPILLFVSFGFGMFVLARRLTDSNLVALGALWIALWVMSLTTFQHLHGIGMRGVMLALWPWVLLLLLRSKPRAPDLKIATWLPIALAGAALAGVGLIRWFLPEAVQLWSILVLIVVGGVALRFVPVEFRKDAGLLTAVAGAMTFIHIIEGPIFFAMGMLFVVLLPLKVAQLRMRMIIGAGHAIVVLFIVAQVAGVLEFDDASMISRALLGNARADAIPIPFEEKFRLFERGFTYTLLALVGLSAVRLLRWPEPVHVASTATVAIALFLYFVPESGLHRIIGPVIPFIALGIAMELWWLGKRIAGLRWEVPPAWAVGVLVVVGLIAITPHLTSPLRAQMATDSILGFPSSNSPRDFSNITRGEYKASAWIGENIPLDWAVVSDPTTMFVIQGLTLHPQIAEKRAWVAESEYTESDQERLRSLRTEVFEAPTVDAALEKIESLTAGHTGVVLVISHRTLDWLLDPGSLFRLSKPREAVSLEVESLQSLCDYYSREYCLTGFFESDKLSAVYNESGVAIFVPTSQLIQATTSDRGGIETSDGS